MSKSFNIFLKDLFVILMTNCSHIFWGSVWEIKLGIYILHIKNQQCLQRFEKSLKSPFFIDKSENTSSIRNYQDVIVLEN